jgi:hypothetical protein
MTTSGDGMDQNIEAVLRQARALYHEPRETPREEMWRVIAAGLAAGPRTGESEPGGASERGIPGAPAAGIRAGSGQLVDLAAARRRRVVRGPRPLWWAAAAAAVLVLGIGIGRMSAPAVNGTSAPVAVAESEPDVGGELGFAAREHLGRTESLLTQVRADARDGRIDPALGTWARGLLSQTRLLMDTRGNADPEVRRLLEDLELLLVQIAGASRAGPSDEARATTELELALRSLDEGGVMSRLHAVVPFGLSGT